MNNGRNMKTERMTATFRELEPSILKIYVNIIKKSIITAAEIMTWEFRLEKKVKSNTNAKSDAKEIKRRKLNLIKSPVFYILQFQKFDFTVNAPGISCQFSFRAQYTVTWNYDCYGIVSDCTSDSLGGHRW